MISVLKAMPIADGQEKKYDFRIMSTNNSTRKSVIKFQTFPEMPKTSIFQTCRQLTVPSRTINNERKQYRLQEHTVTQKND